MKGPYWDGKVHKQAKFGDSGSIKRTAKDAEQKMRRQHYARRREADRRALEDLGQYVRSAPYSTSCSGGHPSETGFTRTETSDLLGVFPRSVPARLKNARLAQVYRSSHCQQLCPLSKQSFCLNRKGVADLLAGARDRPSTNDRNRAQE